MATSGEEAAVPPLSPCYPFNDPGQPVLLHDGLIGGLAATDVSGVLQVSCATGLDLDWSLKPGAPPVANRDEVALVLRRPHGDMPVSAAVSGMDGGWSNGAEFGNSEAPLKRIVAHWFNLPDWHGPIRLTKAAPGGGRSWWSGRWEHVLDEWKITLDVRPDHQRIWRDVNKSHVYVMTHVMEVRRTDGASFTATEAQPLMSALHVGISFALGRWAAPMLPVGQDEDGKVVWEEWRSSHCDPARAITDGWWYDQDRMSLADLLGRVVRAFEDPDKLVPLRFQMIYAISATGGRGFLEPRITMGSAGLEHVMWQTLVLEGQFTELQYRKEPAHKLLRTVLRAASIPVNVESRQLPSAARHITEEQPRQRRSLDGADVVTWVRNRIVHPQGAQEAVYKRDGLMTEAWLLTRHYLVLLILHSLGYRGNYRDLRRVRGWVSDVGKVPWA